VGVFGEPGEMVDPVAARV